ncbi:MAG: type II toxin-antitoxin system prevent-host-death family antitoxin [Anaerolineae bacterium]|jgi:prevent-host-death family protein|nr:type II toxin-antitoxin system prevent-host-death family antitoxin [Anaerolineae bacterium]
MAETIGIRDLKNNTSRIVQAVREEAVEYVVTMRGEPVAVLRPWKAEDVALYRMAGMEDEIEEMKLLAQEIAAAWVSSKSGVELIEEQRR